MSRRQTFNLWLPLLGTFALLAQAAAAQTNITLHLKNGDLLTGTVVSQDATNIVITTSWTKELTVPRTAIEIPKTATVAVTTTAISTNAPLAPTNVVATVALATPPVKPTPPAPPKLWKANVDIGTDLLFGAVDRQLYWGKLNLTYAKPYKTDARKFFRSAFEYNVDYGQSDGVKSTDRMNGSAKMDFDVGSRLYIYNLGTIGYDDIRRIDLQYQIGPGLGYHLLTLPKFVLNGELGLNYQAQHRTAGGDVESIYGRAAQDVTWKISERLTLTEKFEAFPNLGNTGELRARLEATLRFLLLKNLSWNFHVIDLYDTNPAPNVDSNEVQLRSSFGVNF